MHEQENNWSLCEVVSEEDRVRYAPSRCYGRSRIALYILNHLSLALIALEYLDVEGANAS